MHPANELNKAFESRIRLGIMSLLMVNDWVDFATFKETFDLTDGNLASHLSALEKIEFIQIRKIFTLDSFIVCIVFGYVLLLLFQVTVYDGVVDLN